MSQLSEIATLFRGGACLGEIGVENRSGPRIFQACPGGSRLLSIAAIAATDKRRWLGTHG